MVAIKGLKMPKDCKKCPLMGTDGNPKDLLSPMMCVAIWATKHEIKHCVGGEILDDCPLVDIEERKVGKWLSAEEYAIKLGEEVTETVKNSLYKFCPFCEQTVFMERNYCPNCGSRMTKED